MASEEDVLLREVDEDLSRDQTFERFRKFRVPLAVGAVAIIVAVGAYEFISAGSERARAEGARAYAELSFASEAPVSPERLATFAEEHDGGYAVLAAFRAAGQLAQEGDLEAARDLYAQVWTNEQVSASMRDFARMRAAYALFDNLPDEAARIASSVETEAFRPHAEEISAGIALKNGNYEAARAGFEALAANPQAGETLRQRAEAYAAVADAAASGADVTAKTAQAQPDISSFIEQVGARLEAAGEPVGEAGTDPVLTLPEPEGEAPDAASGPDVGEDAQ